MIHSAFRQKTKIRIILKSGQQIIALFKESKRNRLMTLDKGEFDFNDLRSVNYYKPHPHELTNN